MRHNLQSLEGRRTTFTATFDRYGTWRSNGIAGRTILLRDIRTRDGIRVAQHIWINYTAGFDAAGELARGERVRFTAKVKPYVKGYFGERIDDRLQRPSGIDYALVYPRNVIRLDKPTATPVCC